MLEEISSHLSVKRSSDEDGVASLSAWSSVLFQNDHDADLHH